MIGPALPQLIAGAKDSIPNLIAAATYDLVALSIAAVLSVFKPGAAFRVSHS